MTADDPDSPWPKEITPALLPPLCPVTTAACHLHCSPSAMLDCLHLLLSSQHPPGTLPMPLAEFEAWKAEQAASRACVHATGTAQDR